MSGDTFELLVEWAERQPVTIRREDGDEATIRERALANAYEQRGKYMERRAARELVSAGDDFIDDFEPDPDKALANYLRHQCSNYDELCKQLSEGFEFNDEGRFEESGERFEEDIYEKNDVYLQEQRKAYLITRDRVNDELSKAFPQFADVIALHGPVEYF